MSKITWLVVANSDKALVYQVDHMKYQFIKELDHNESRLKTEDLMSGKPGHFTTPTVDSHEHEHIVFAKALAVFLDGARNQNQYHALIVCADPHFSGLLEKEMSKQVQELIMKHIHKDYVPFPVAKLNEAIEGILKETVF